MFQGKWRIMAKTLHVWVEGRVQGVFFRDSTRKKARELGLKGWVKNLPDGRVEALFNGPESACWEALGYVTQGPPRAVVTHVEHSWEDDPGETPAGFEVRF
jgi:acylphosphatase